jgi:REP element-mobilizing transposase RayT
MPDHIHLIASMGPNAVRLGQWIKALKAVVGGLKRNETPDPVGRVSLYGDPTSPPDAGSGDPAYLPPPVGRVPLRGDPPPSPNTRPIHPATRLHRSWRWQEGFHDHKFRSPQDEQRKWEYICLNPVRAHYVTRPEDWPFGGEIYYEVPTCPRCVRGTPPLLETGILIPSPKE